MQREHGRSSTAVGSALAGGGGAGTRPQPLKVHNRILKTRTTQKQNRVLIKQLIARQCRCIDAVDITDQCWQSINSINLPATANSMNRLILFIDRTNTQHRLNGTDQQFMLDLVGFVFFYRMFTPLEAFLRVGTLQLKY